jgi:hypothetical protein
MTLVNPVKIHGLQHVLVRFYRSRSSNSISIREKNMGIIVLGLESHNVFDVNEVNSIDRRNAHFFKNIRVVQVLVKKLKPLLHLVRLVNPYSADSLNQLIRVNGLHDVADRTILTSFDGVLVKGSNKDDFKVNRFEFIQHLENKSVR